MPIQRLSPLAATLDLRRGVSDVRLPSEFAASHIAGARLVVLPRLGYEAGDWDKQAPLLLVCRGGRQVLRRRWAA